MVEKKFEYGYPALIWYDEDDNFALDEHHQLMVKFNEFTGKLSIYDCSDDEAIRMAKAIAVALKGIYNN